MDSIFALVAKGPNDIDKICRIFKTEKEAKDFCENLGLKNFWKVMKFNKKTKKYYLSDEIKTLPEGHYLMGNDDSSWDDDKEDYVDSPNIKAIFTDYYNGCGRVHKIVIEEVQFNTTFTGWDLD